MEMTQLKNTVSVDAQLVFCSTFGKGEKHGYECHMPLHEQPWHQCQQIVTVVK